MLPGATMVKYREDRFTKETRVAFRSDRNVFNFYCGDGFTGIDTCRNSSHCTLEVCV